MSGPKVARDTSAYEEAQYVLKFSTENGLKAKVHVNQLKEDPRPEFEICPQGNKEYGIVAFFLYTSWWLGEKVSIRRVVSGQQYSYEI